MTLHYITLHYTTLHYIHLASFGCFPWEKVNSCPFQLPFGFQLTVDELRFAPPKMPWFLMIPL